MVLFYRLFPEVAQRETRVLKTFRFNTLGLPPDTYVLVELYCERLGCDCRRVMINVMAEGQRRHVATINHGFEPSPDDDLGQTFLDPLNRQSELAPKLLKFVRDHVLRDAEYVARLHRHYQMFKAAVNENPDLIPPAR